MSFGIREATTGDANDLGEMYDVSIDRISRDEFQCNQMFSGAGGTSEDRWRTDRRSIDH